MSPALTLKWTTCFVLELTLTTTRESLWHSNWCFIHSELFIVTLFLLHSASFSRRSVSSKLRGDTLRTASLLSNGLLMCWWRLRSLLYEEGEESPRLENLESCLRKRCFKSPWLPVWTARQESISVSRFNMLSDSKQLLNCEPKELFLEWYADEVLELWKGGRDGVSETVLVWLL